MKREVEAWRDWPLPEPGTTLRRWHDGRCAWCGYPEGRLVKDHCHTTGLVRGLLCSGCNQAEANDFRHAWDKWRAGDHPAHALGHFEVYQNIHGRTPLRPMSALAYYTEAEQESWWEALEVEYQNGGVWPTEAPWTQVAAARRDADMEAMRSVVFSLDLPFLGGAK